MNAENISHVSFSCKDAFLFVYLLEFFCWCFWFVGALGLQLGHIFKLICVKLQNCTVIKIWLGGWNLTKDFLGLSRWEKLFFEFWNLLAGENVVFEHCNFLAGEIWEALVWLTRWEKVVELLVWFIFAGKRFSKRWHCVCNDLVFQYQVAFMNI